jgi:hypothetical protein
MILGLLIFVLAASASLVWLCAGGIQYIKENSAKIEEDDFIDLDFTEDDKNNIS